MVEAFRGTLMVEFATFLGLLALLVLDDCEALPFRLSPFLSEGITLAVAAPIEVIGSLNLFVAGVPIQLI